MTLRAQLAGRLAFPLGFNLGRSKLWPDTGAHDGISFSAATGLVSIKAPGGAPSVQSLTSAFTFTGGNQSMYRAANGLLVQSVTNTPRIEYDANGACLGLLMETSRTNLCLQSATLDAAEWTNTQASVGANVIASPDGTSTADKITEDGTTNVHGNRVTTDIAIVANATYTLSCFAKAAERSVLYLKLSNSADGNGVAGTFDLSAGTATPNSFGTGSGAVVSIKPYAGGWYRCIVTGAINNAEVLARPRIRIFNGTESYTGNGASGLYAWGVQFEPGAFASSYTPTTTVAVARTADSCIRTLGSEFSATAGTVVVRATASGGQQANNQFVWAIDDNGFNESIRLTRFTNSDTARWLVVDGGVVQSSLDETFVNLTAFKHACAFALNDFAESFNGGAAQTDVAGTLPTVTSLQLGLAASGGQMNGHILTFDYYPSRLANAQLQALTA